MHRQTLEMISNALSHRSDPATVPEISGMDGIPAQDLQEFRSRIQPTNPQTSAVSKQFKPSKPDAAVKKAKIDAPLDPETIQAQLAEFQRKKEDQEIQELIKQGLTFPPGLTPRQVLQVFGFRNPPPGTGPFAAKNPNQLIPPAIASNPPTLGVHGPPPSKTFADGKSDSPALSSQFNPSFNSAYSPKFVSKSAFLNDGG
jgi:hypothetical protein